jgi:hypothetical protein
MLTAVDAALSRSSMMVPARPAPRLLGRRILMDHQLLRDQPTTAWLVVDSPLANRRIASGQVAASLQLIRRSAGIYGNQIHWICSG